MENMKNGNHPLLEAFLTIAPYINSLFKDDISLGLANLEHYLISTPGKTFELGIKPGDPLTEGDAITLAIKTNKVQQIYVPEEVFGFPIFSTAIPLHDEKGNIIGGVAIGVSLEEQYRALSGVANNLSEAVTQVTGVIDELASTTSNLSESMNEITSQSTDVLNSVKEIEKVVTMVRTISEHSRMLGINASIEAARAGEAGRGFAVVAEEVQKLANNSAKNTDVINQSVYKINSLIENLNSSINKIKAEAENQSAVAEELTATMKEINNAADHLANVTVERLKGSMD